MREIRSWAPFAAVLLAATLAACGGGDGDQTPRVAYSKMVSFGDSLSDVGSYRVGAIAQLGGGEYSINGSAGVNWYCNPYCKVVFNYIHSFVTDRAGSPSQANAWGLRTQLDF